MRRQMMCAIVVGMAFSSAASAATLFFDFGNSNTAAGGNYNNVDATQQPIPDAVDSSGANSGIGLTTTGFNVTGGNTDGTQTPIAPANEFDVAATRDSLYGHDGTWNGDVERLNATLTLSGLDDSGLTSYSLTFFASRTNSSGNRETEYAVSGLTNSSVFLNPVNNTSDVATMSGMIPASGGTIAIDVHKGSNNNNTPYHFFYLGAMKIESTTVPEPATLGLLAVAGVAFVLQRRNKS